MQNNTIADVPSSMDNIATFFENALDLVTGLPMEGYFIAAALLLATNYAGKALQWGVQRAGYGMYKISGLRWLRNKVTKANPAQWAKRRFVTGQTLEMDGVRYTIVDTHRNKEAKSHTVTYIREGKEWGDRLSNDLGKARFLFKDATLVS